MFSLEDYMRLPRWALWLIVIGAGTLGYLAYGTSIFDFHLSIIPPAFNSFLGFFWKWLVTPMALVMGGILLFALFISRDDL